MNRLLIMPQFWLIILILISMSMLLILLPAFKSKALSKTFYVGCCSFLLIGTFGLYLHYGASDQLAEKYALVELKKGIAKITEDPNIPRDKALAQFHSLEEKLAFSPTALTQMASIYNQLGLFDEAINALEKAQEISPHEVECQVQWVYTQSLKNQGKLDSRVRQKAQAILSKNPEQYSLINLLAIDDYFSGNYPQAIQEWEWLLKMDEALAADKKALIHSALAKAKTHLPKEESVRALSLAVKVKISPLLQKQLLPTDRVFVFVKQLGDPMPLAVINKSAKALPFSVDFDSKHSMIAGKTLKPGMKVEVVAKLSKTGDALDKKGEWRSKSHQIELKSVNEPIEIEIN